MKDSIGTYTVRRVINLRPASEITDRAKRYRAQKNVKGPKRCVVCNGSKDLGVMHLSGDESDGEPKNLAWGCRSCNQVLSAAWIEMGSPIRTRQFNPAGGRVPSFAQYSWGVSNHQRGAHDEGGAIIHATPRSKRIEYAQRIANIKRQKRRSAESVPF